METPTKSLTIKDVCDAYTLAEEIKKMLHALFVAFGATLGIILALVFFHNIRAILRFFVYAIIVVVFSAIMAIGLKDMREQDAIEAASKSRPVAVPAVQVQHN